MAKLSYTTVEIAKMFDVYPTTVADWVDAGRLVAYRTAGGHRRVRMDDLRNFLKEMNMPLPPELGATSPVILIIDDNEDDSFALKSGLDPHQMQVHIATGGFDGIFKIGRIRPDVVILDLLMPGMNGVEVCEEIKSRGDLEHTSVIAVSGYENDDLRQKILHKGAEAFFIKPVDIPKLVETIHKLTGAPVIGS